MSEVFTLGLVCAAGIPVTGLIVGLICAYMQRRALEHFAETQIVGGVPRKVVEERELTDLRLKERRLAPKPLDRRKVVA